MKTWDSGSGLVGELIMAERKFEERWENFRDLVEHLFLEPGRGSLEADVVWYPATDVYETEKELVIRMDVSGVDQKLIKIMMRGNGDRGPGRTGRLHPEGKKDVSQDGDRDGSVHTVDPGPRNGSSEPRPPPSTETASWKIKLRARARSGPQEIEIEVN